MSRPRRAASGTMSYAPPPPLQLSDDDDDFESPPPRASPARRRTSTSKTATPPPSSPLSDLNHDADDGDETDIDVDMLDASDDDDEAVPQRPPSDSEMVSDPSPPSPPPARPSAVRRTASAAVGSARAAKPAAKRRARSDGSDSDDFSGGEPEEEEDDDDDFVATPKRAAARAPGKPTAKAPSITKLPVVASRTPVKPAAAAAPARTPVKPAAAATRTRVPTVSPAAKRRKTDPDSDADNNDDESNSDADDSPAPSPAMSATPATRPSAAATTAPRPAPVSTLPTPSRTPLKPLGLVRNASMTASTPRPLGLTRTGSMQVAMPSPSTPLPRPAGMVPSGKRTRSGAVPAVTPPRPLGLSMRPVARSSSGENGSSSSSPSAVPTSLVKPFKAPTFKKPPVGALAQRNHNLNRALGMRAGLKPPARPLHDPDAPDAIVLWRPPEVSATELLSIKEEDKEVAVVIDPTLGRILRPHQITGVEFMYQCVIGERVEGVQGCIMADEMGLGKTLQCIALLWTLLRQSPKPGKPWIEKAIIVCPSSLVRNWANELVKWLGENAIHPLCADNKGSKEQSINNIKQFVSAHGRGVIYPILIISYESLRIYSEYLGKSEIGLMLCDEGHRLKNPDSQTYQALNALNVPRRVILSGTPIQNDLTEYFALLNFACPTLLGEPAHFRKHYKLPIERGRDADATDKEKDLCEERMRELVKQANSVMIRRTQDLLRKYLPTKQEHVVFIKLAPEQETMYRNYLASDEVKRLLRGKDSQPLQAIGYLKKLVNHPKLVDEKRPLNVAQGGKLVVLERMLHKIKTTTKDKIVLISNYTQTLDVMEQLCQSRAWGSLRLDGTMTVKKRQKLVDQFNDPNGSEFVFLLSSKAGGCGLNLIGANRLILFDPDWNPASDMQALARVWRDGQQKTCFIYRFIATGTIEEKIFQRQCHKQMLSNCVVDAETDVERHFSLDNLKELFQYNAATLSDTHASYKCKRCINDIQSKPPARSSSARNEATDMSLWNHFSKKELNKVPDGMLREAGKDLVTFVFQNEVTG
ncbi:DNA-dependent ATPase protein rad54 [Allomyces javanicus]|nr:DNA-dependent ATPase protein rad54 [Allomyces javanicus]